MILSRFEIDICGAAADGVVNQALNFFEEFELFGGGDPEHVHLACVQINPDKFDRDACIGSGFVAIENFLAGSKLAKHGVCNIAEVIDGQDFINICHLSVPVYHIGQRGNKISEAHDCDAGNDIWNKQNDQQANRSGQNHGTGPEGAFFESQGE